MATANFSLNPLLVTSAPGTFATQSEGYIQGTAMDDPAVRYALAGGVLNSTETVPMWGGVGIYENVPFPPIQTSFPQDNLGSLVGRATTTALIQGFSVFNQAHAWITTPQSQVPTAGAGMGVNFYRLGSGARIVVKADPAIASLEGGIVNTQSGFTWDCNAQVLQPFEASATTLSVTGITVSNGVATVTLSGTLSGWTFTAGDTVVLSGATNSGTAPVGLLNAPQKIASVTDTTHFTFNLPTNQGTWGTIAGTILLNYGGGVLNVKLLGLNVGNSMVVNYDAVNNYGTWDRAGTTAVILI
jgi:hypothetical protein